MFMTVYKFGDFVIVHDKDVHASTSGQDLGISRARKAAVFANLICKLLHESLVVSLNFKSMCKLSRSHYCNIELVPTFR